MTPPLARLQALAGWRRALALITAGAASALALAPVHAWPVMFLTLPVLVWLLDAALIGEVGSKRLQPSEPPARVALARLSSAVIPRRVKTAFWIGWLFGFGYFLAGLYWIGAPFLVEADAFGWLMPFAVLLMPSGLALFFGAATALAGLLWRPGYRRILALALGFGGCEWLRGHVLTGFPWNLLGYTLTGNAALMQTAALVGVNGLTVLAVVLFSAPSLITTHRTWRQPGVVLPLLALCMAWAWGQITLRAPSPGTVDGVRLRLVQPNISQAQKWTPDNKNWIFQGFLDLSRLSPQGTNDDLAGITHVIWPESSVPFLLLDSPNALRAIADIMPRGGHLLTGALRLEEQAGAAGEPPLRRVFNSLVALDSDAKPVGIYDKSHLVPFGEYLPLQPLLEAIGLRQLTRVRGGFTAGTPTGRLLQIPGLPAFSPLICYEIIFPAAAVPGGLKPGQQPQFLLNVTNDAWFGTTSGPYQHLQQARVRAVEEGLPVIRVANNGVSAVIDGRGNVLALVPLNTRGTLDANLPRRQVLPIYARFGDGMLLLELVLLLAGYGMLARYSRRGAAEDSVLC